MPSPRRGGGEPALAAPTAPDTGSARGAAPEAGDTFAGRAPDLARLTEAWQRARAGRRQVVLVGGEAGIGKTRLATEAALAAGREGAVVLHGRCDEDTAVPYQPVAEALERYVAGATDPDDLRRHVGRDGGELARLVVGLAQRLPDLAPPAPTEAETDRNRLFRAVASFLAAVAASAPVVLVLDDLQWATAPTVLLLHHLVRALEGAAVLVIGTYRDDEAGANPALADELARLRREPGVERVALAGLDEAAVAALVREATGPDLSPAEEAALARRLHRETDGNPFYVGELLRHLAETGGMGEEDLGVPESVREVVGRRLVRLSDSGVHDA